MMSLKAITGIDALRILCGLFLVPHMIWDLSHPREGAKIYDVAGIGFSEILFPLATCTEIALIVSLIAGIFPRLAAAVAVAYLGVAAAVMWKLERQWFWNLKGVEFLVFWACCCVVVSICQS